MGTQRWRFPLSLANRSIAHSPSCREHVTERLRAFRAAGVDTVTVTPTTTTRDGRIEQLRELAAAAEAV